jgi:hypothetical protein
MHQQDPTRAEFRQPCFKIVAHRHFRMMAIDMQQIDALRVETLLRSVKSRPKQSRKSA